MRRRLTLLAAVPLLSGAVVFGTAGGASADPPDNASCVAQAVHSFPGPPGQAQRHINAPKFGQVVSFVAHIPPEVCAEIFD